MRGRRYLARNVANHTLCQNTRYVYGYLFVCTITDIAEHMNMHAHTRRRLYSHSDDLTQLLKRPVRTTRERRPHRAGSWSDGIDHRAVLGILELDKALVRNLGLVGRLCQFRDTVAQGIVVSHEATVLFAPVTD